MYIRKNIRLFFACIFRRVANVETMRRGPESDCVLDVPLRLRIKNKFQKHSLINPERPFLFSVKKTDVFPNRFEYYDYLEVTLKTGEVITCLPTRFWQWLLTRVAHNTNQFCPVCAWTGRGIENARCPCEGCEGDLEENCKIIYHCREPQGT
jgi:hypothetical protein